LIEFAIILPVLAILVCGVIDLGRAYHLKNQLKNAAREGAIYGQTHPLSQQIPPASTDSDDPCANLQSIQARAYGELQQSGQADPENLVVTVDPATTCNVSPADGSLDSTEELTVSARSDFSLITPIMGAIVGSPIVITETVTVEIQ